MGLQTGNSTVTAISYHATVNDLHLLGLTGKGPFGQLPWFVLLEQAGNRPVVIVARSGTNAFALPLVRSATGLRVLTNWYAFTWQPLQTPDAHGAMLTDLARDLAYHTSCLVLDKLPDENGAAALLEQTFRKARWFVQREVVDANHYLRVAGRTFDAYLATRPGALRTTLNRKAKKVELRLARTFDAADWAAYEEIYRNSWKPEEGDPALLRRFAEHESQAGHYLFGMALADGVPVAAQFWTVEGGVAYIHKLAHLESAQPLSPGTTLTAALLAEVIDHDRVREVDFGTGNDGYKADWMDAVRPRYRLICLRPADPRNWPAIAKVLIRKLVSRATAG